MKPSEIYELYTDYYGFCEEGKVYTCTSCRNEFVAWFKCLKQNVRGKNYSCCKLCLDKMRKSFESNRLQYIRYFSKGFQRKKDSKEFLNLTFKQKVKYIREVSDYGISLYHPGKT